MKRNRNARGEGGAALVEMALVTPLLLLLLLGIIEFGYVFAQYNEVRHAAREGARYAAVSEPNLDAAAAINKDDVIFAVCNAIDLSNATIEVTLDSDGSPTRLENAELTVVADISSLSNAPIISSFVPDEISNTAVFRLEQDAKWVDFQDEVCP